MRAPLSRAGEKGNAREPTEVEMRGAIAELIQGLQETVEEIREEMEGVMEVLDGEGGEG